MDTQIKKIELLSPIGDFECLKAAVQNGDVYKRQDLLTMLLIR